MTPQNPVDDSVLPLLRCPVTRSSLVVADQELVTQANQLIADAQLTDRLGQLIPGVLDAGLVNEDGSLLIPVRGGIVVMLEDRLIPMSQLSNEPSA